MKRKFTFLIAAALMLLTMMATTGTMWGQTWEKATSIQVGDVVVLVTENSNNSTTKMELTDFSSTSTVYGIGTAYTSTPACTYTFEVVAGKTDGTFAFKHGSSYLYWASGNSLNVNSTLSANTSWTVSINGTTSKATIKNAADNTRQIWWNVSSPRFACYTDKTEGKSYYITTLYKQVTSGDTPSITANNVDIAYNATEGSIGYTLHNATGNVNAEVTNGDWLTLGTITEDEVPFTCSANEGNERTATVTLSFTGASNKVVTITQAGNPDAPGTQNNPYTVAQARAAIDAETGVTGVYATGIVSAIPTAWSTQYNNITFNIVYESGDEDFLQAFRCVSTTSADASTVAVGDVVVVYGNLIKYGSTYEFGSGCQLISLEHPSTPYFTANDVNITYDATAGSIAYTVENSVQGGQVTAATTSTWLTLGTDFTSPITFTCDANEAGERTATVTLTYTYGTKTTVNKEVTVTQAGNPNVFDNISDITKVGTAYSVKGTVVAINSRGFVMGDGTGYVYYYKNAAPTQAVNDMVTVAGTTGTYGQIIQFTNSATVTEATTSNYDGTPAATLITAVPNYSTGYHLSTYLEFEGALEKSGSNYFITLGESQIQISYPNSAQSTALTALDGKTVHVKGYFSGINSSSKFTVMLESAEEVLVPSITLQQYEYNLNADGGDAVLPVTYTNMPANPQAEVIFYEANGTTTATYDWITASINANYNIAGHINVNEGDARSAYFKVKGKDANNNDVYSNLVTINQAAPAAPSISFTQASMSLIAGGEQNRQLSFDYSGLGSNPTFTINYYEQDGTTAATYNHDWLTATIANDKLNVTAEANDGEARTVYLRVYGEKNANVHAESNLVTITQAAYVVDYATLPFSWDDTSTPTGITNNGVGTYSSSPYLKFDGTGDYIILKINERPGTLSFDIKGNGFGNGSIFKLQTSADGTTYTDLKTYTELGATLNESFDNLGENVRYIKWIYTEKAQNGGNVALGNIALAKYTEPVPSISAEDVNIAYDATGGSIAYTINNPVEGGSMSSMPISGGDWLTVGGPSNGNVPLTCEQNTGAERTATVTLTYTYNTNQTVTKDVTVSQAAAPVPSITVDPETITWNNSPINVGLSQTITVSQANLTDDIEITTTIGAVDPTSIEAGAEATEITFTYTPKTAGDFEGTITLTSGTTVKEITVSGSAVEPSGESWVKVESADDLEVDGVYVIAVIHNDYNKVAGDISNQLLSCHAAIFSANHDEITELPDEAIRFTLGGEEGAWTFANQDDKLLGSTTAKKMAWNNGTTTWDLSFEGNFVMENTTSYGTLQYNYNGGSDRFTTYTSVQTPIQLYKLTSSNPRIVAQDVDLESSETEGSIIYEVKNSVEGGELTASVPANSWITLGEVGDESIPFTCEANTGDERTETVTLTYTYNTNETVTKDITVTQAAYIAPVYGITIFTVLPQHVEVDVKDAQGENINTATEGTIVYLTAIPDECWEFTGWLVVNTTPDPSELVTVTDDHFTMPAGEVTVQALIEEKTLYTINYNSNGVTTSEQVCENPIAAEDLLTPDNVPAGFSFAGWTSDKATTDIVTSVTLSDEPTTLYAVFSIEEGSIPGDFTLVTEELDDWSGDYLIAYDDNTFANGQNGGTTGIGAASSSVDPGTNLSNNIVNGSWGCNYYITLEKVDANSSTYLLKTQDGYYNYQTSNNNGIATSINRETAANCPLSVSLGDDGNIEISVSGTMFSYNSGNGGFFRFYKNNGANQNKVYAYKRGTDTPGTLAYYINVFQNETVEGDIIIDSKTVIPSGVILDMNVYNINNTEPANLVIEDGGQLVFNGTGVMATMLKSTAHAGAKDGVGDWYTIASPLAANVETNAVGNLTNGTYDLYRYNEAAVMWENAKDTEHSGGFNKLTVGRGYLYWNGSGSDITFAGELRNADVAYNLKADGAGNYKGFNLIGNPFSQNITMANIDGVSLTGGYVLTKAGGWGATVGEIAPCQGFLVQVKDETNITISKSIGSKSRANRDYIAFTVANNQYEDVAYAMFSNGLGLDKIDHRNAEIPMVYIPQNGQNYAIATMSDDTEMFNLNFKAMTTGQHTLRVDTKGNYSYLHIYDKMTNEDVDMLLEGEYSFIGSPRDAEDRFVVRLSYRATIDGNDTNIFAYQSGSDIIVSGNGELQVFDVMGRMVATMHVNGVQTMSTSSLQTGLYIFRLNEKTQKIVVR